MLVEWPTAAWMSLRLRRSSGRWWRARIWLCRQRIARRTLARLRPVGTTCVLAQCFGARAAEAWPVVRAPAAAGVTSAAAARAAGRARASERTGTGEQPPLRAAGRDRGGPDPPVAPVQSALLRQPGRLSGAPWLCVSPSRGICLYREEQDLLNY